MTSPTLRATAHTLYAVARDCLVTHGYIIPRHLIVNRNGDSSPLALAELPENIDVTQARIVDTLEQLAPRVFAIATVQETWVALGDDGEPRVSELADCQEAILVTVQSRDCGTRTLVAPFKRDDRGQPLPPENATNEWISSGFEHLLQFY